MGLDIAKREFQLHMKMCKGDVQYVNNFTVIHSSTAYRDGSGTKRHDEYVGVECISRDFYVRESRLASQS